VRKAPWSASVTTLYCMCAVWWSAGTAHSSYTDAFVQTHRVGVCRGPYPVAFFKAWKAWDKRHKSENDAIAGLPDEQLYAVFAMANCGRDLESYKLQGYEQVRSLMLQVCRCVRGFDGSFDPCKLPSPRVC